MRVTVVLLALLTLGGCASPAPTASLKPQTPSASLPLSASPTIGLGPTISLVPVITDTPLPPGGISRDQAIAIAKEHAVSATVVDAVVGPVGNLSTIVNPPGLGIKLDRPVWKVSFIASGGERYGRTFGPTMISVFLDYYTGAFLFTD